MASETPDPSSSELLTDFDIADVENWDDQNDNSKEIDLVKMPSVYEERQRLSSPQMHVTNPLNRNSNSQGFTSMGQLRKLTSSMQESGSVIGEAFRQQPVLQHTLQDSVSHSTPQLSSTFHEPSQSSGHALATLRALAQAQEEQARLIKEQEKAKQEPRLPLERTMNNKNCGNITDDQELLKPSSPEISPTQSNTTNPVSVSGCAKNPENNLENLSNKDKSVVPITTVQLPTGDKKDGGKQGKSVLQLKGQLVRTHDQKLMLVTEVGGKKVGYLISPQSGQLPPGVAAQLMSKNIVGGEQVQLPSQKMSSPKLNATVENSSTVATAVATAKLNAANDLLNSTPELHKTPTVNKEGSEPKSTLMNHVEQMDVSSGEVDSSLAEVATSLKNTHLEPVIAGSKGADKGKKKRRGKGKKKKDSNEPAKPISPYLMFFKDVQATVRQQNPMAGLGEVSRLVSQRWEKASDEEKRIYNDRSLKAKEEYQIKLAEYRAGLAAESENTPASPAMDHSGSGMNQVGLSMDQSGSSVDQSGSSMDPIVLDSSVDAEESNPQIPVIKEQTEPTSQTGLRLALSPNDSPVYNYVTSKPNQPIQPTTIIEDISTENTLPCSPATATPTIEIDDDNSNSDDVTAGKRSKSKSSKKSKNHNRGKEAAGLVDDAKRAKIMKLNNSLVDAEEDVKLLKGKISKKIKKKQKLLQIESLKSPPKLTMKINIKDSKITESPTKSPLFLEESVAKESFEDEKEIADDAEEERKPSTQPSALLSFKIPLKRPLSPNESKGNSEAVVKRDVKSSGPRQCADDNCENSAKITRERGPMYCSNQCLVNHCRNVFQQWVTERKSEASSS